MARVSSLSAQLGCPEVSQTGRVISPPLISPCFLIKGLFEFQRHLEFQLSLSSRLVPGRSDPECLQRGLNGLSRETHGSSC